MKVPFTNQCAEITRIALGCGTKSRSEANPRLQRLSSMTFIGEPCPANITGILSEDGPGRIACDIV